MNRISQQGRTSTSTIIFLAIIAFFIASQLFNDKPTNQPPHSQASGNTAGDPSSTMSQGSYAVRATDNSWPVLAENGSTDSIGENLLKENYYVVLDGSGSMKDSKCSGGHTKIRVALDALSGFVKNIPHDANFAFSVFVDNQLREIIPLQPISQSNLGVLSNTISPAGGTPLYSAINAAYGKIIEQGRRQLGYGQYNLIVITDGIASEGQDPSPVIEKMFYESPISLHTIGFCIGENHALNQKGRAIYYAANSPDELSKGLEAVLAEAPQFDQDQF